MRNSVRSRLIGVLLSFLSATAWAAYNPNDGFVADADNSVRALAVQPDGKIIVGGLFTNIAGESRVRIARMEADGTVDTGFAVTDVDSTVWVVAVQADGRILIGGSFNQVGTFTRNHIARLNANGSVDAGFDPDISGVSGVRVRAIAVQPDGKLVIGGNFDTIGGATRNRIARLNADGTVDALFNPDAQAEVLALALQPDGKLVVGGFFLAIDGLPRAYLARLNANGTFDMSFIGGAAQAITDLAIQPDGKILASGIDVVIGGVNVNAMNRLNTDGSVDTTFQSSPNNNVETLELQADGKIVIGGLFTMVDGQARSRIARLNPDGSLDSELTDGANGAVFALALQADGKLAVGGRFSTLAGQPRSNLGRLSAPQSVVDSLDIVRYSGGGSMIRWIRGGSAPELSQPPLLSGSMDGATYTSLGVMQRSGSNWEYTGFAPPSSTQFYLRAMAPVGSGGESSGMVQSTRQVYLTGNDGIFIDGFD